MKNIWKMLMIVSLGLFLAACSLEGLDQYSPDQIVAKAVEDNENITGFYMKTDFDVYKGEEKIEDSIIEQWTDKENKRIKSMSETAKGEVSMSVNDGEKIIHYSSLQGDAVVMDTLEENDQFIGQSPKDDLKFTLENLRETHNIEVVGDEEINGFDTYHIKATPKKKDSLMGEEEYWISKNNWFIIKSISKSDDLTIEYTVTELEINPVFDEETFTIDLPEGVELKTMEEMDPAEKTTLAELAENYGQPILTSKNYDLVSAEKFYMEGFDRTEATQEFMKDGYKQFILTSFEAPEEELSVGLEEKEEIEVRGVKAIYMNDVIQNLVWDEDGMSYSLLSMNPELTKEDLIEIAENLEFVEK
ncbi:outer membrane lipoprotein carrier protein LolA [Gracilibacillus oryzae]|uniref:Outer membrane lipoprotein carrier protein LolA n=1 Tax=Gracilibacillus oryzae TaxID=1672701 RepID=A0A7C8GUD2_9BACI|nr:outer membrane lipoprotein-sorting protein [Gracilibacillus oryzae]KAB8136752.1 outer membrane lipoprotein carrier protein LolA [Gracilibacillus oryzae]